MDKDPTLKILNMVKEGFLTPEQGQRLIKELQEELRATHSEPAKSSDSSQNQNTASPLGDVFSFFGQGMEKVLRDFQTGFDFASQTVKDNLGLGPQNLVIKSVVIETGKEKLSLSFPLKLFLAFKSVLLVDNPLMPPPIRGIDFKAIFQSLETGETGKVFELVDSDKGERLEVWVI